MAVLSSAAGVEKDPREEYHCPVRELDIRRDSATVLFLSRKKRNFIIELRGKDYILKHAASDLLEKMRMHDRRKTV